MPNAEMSWVRRLGILRGTSLAVVLLTTSCGEEQTGPALCVPTSQYFAESVWSPILSQKCATCHNPLGQARNSKMVLKSSSEAGFLEANMKIVREVASFEKGGASILLLKPTQSIDHGGGAVITTDGPEFQALSALVARFNNTENCIETTEAHFNEVTLLSDAELLRKASLALGGRLPTAAERQAVAERGDAALREVLDGLMREESFYQRIKEIYNDRLLTDRYASGAEAVGLAAGITGYDAAWYNELKDPKAVTFYGVRSADELPNYLRTQTNLAVAREPIELIAHVVRNDHPFTEIVTADYILVNPFSAKAYGLRDVKFKNEADPREFQPAKMSTFPHSGVLTSPMFLNRHPTTPTNRNRHRARMIYEWFLGTDILKTAERPIDPTLVSDFNPTLNNPACTVCHQNIDPIAGAFHSFDERGKYMPDDTWFPEMSPPGFGNERVPFEQFSTSIQWLGTRLAADPRFALSAIFVLYTGLTGQNPVVAPTDGKDPNYSIQFRAYMDQYEVFSAIAKQFVDSEYNLKTAVRGIILSPYFRAKNSSPLSSDRVVALGELGTARFLTPEQLNRKIAAVTGYPWRRTVSDPDYLLNENEYSILYGGINSDDVTKRMREPNGIMANISDRMANEMACRAVPRDFTVDVNERKLFPFVEVSYKPEDENGFPVDAAVEAIQKNIQYLHERVLGESLALGDPELLRTYNVFLETWREGFKGMKNTEAPYPTSLPGVCQVRTGFWNNEPLPDEAQLVDDADYTVRAWMAVLTYLLGDYDFLHE